MIFPIINNSKALLTFSICFILVSIIGFHTQAQEKPPGDYSWQATLTRAKEDYTQGNYPEAMKGALAVYELALSKKDKDMLADAGNLIGLVDLAQGKAKVAASSFNTALQINRSLHNMQRAAANLINLSLAYTDLNDIDSAIIYIKQSLKITISLDLKDLRAMGSNHLGDFYLRQHKLEEAESKFKAVLQDKSYQSDWENSFACTGMAKVYFARKHYRQAAIYADQAYHLALNAHARWDAVQALELSQQSYYAIGESKRAYDRLLTEKALNDSLFNAGKDKELNKLQLKQKSFENRHLKNQIQIVSQQRKIDRLVIIIIMIALLLIITFSVLIYIRNRQTDLNNKSHKAENEAGILRSQIMEMQNEELSLINKDNNRLFSIIGHDLRSPFASIENTLELFRSGDLEQEELFSLLEKLSAEINTASGMLNSLLIWSANQMGGISFKPVKVDLNMKVDKVVKVSLAAANYKKIQLKHDQIPVPRIVGDADQIRIMIQNLIANAIKFTNENGIVRIYYSPREDYIDLFVEDDGIGMSAEKLKSILTGANQSSTYGTGNEKGIGLGLHLVRDFATQNDIIFLGESVVGKGSKFILRFKLATIKSD